MLVLLHAQRAGDSRAHERLVVHACPPRQDVTEQTAAEIRVLVLLPDVAGSCTRRETRTAARPCSPRTGSRRLSDCMFAGRRGKPDVWVARSCSVIVRPPRSGTRTSGGRYFAIGSRQRHLSALHGVGEQQRREDLRHRADLEHRVAVDDDASFLASRP